LHISEYSRQVHGHEARKDAHVILGGVDHERFSPDRTVRRERTVLYVGRILPHKGVDYLVRGVPEDVPLLVAGEPYDRGFLDYLHGLAQGKQVRFVHGLSDAELVLAYRSAAVTVLPSVYRTSSGSETGVPELLGQVPLEAMACETPVICTRVASLPEVVSDGETGFLVPPNDAAALGDRIRWILAHPAEARRMGEAGRRRILERFTWEGVVERCLRLYGLQP
jgi:glycosyltransferase involved in cell wall biosynthesis